MCRRIQVKSTDHCNKDDDSRLHPPPVPAMALIRQSSGRSPISHPHFVDDTDMSTDAGIVDVVVTKVDMPVESREEEESDWEYYSDDEDEEEEEEGVPTPPPKKKPLPNMSCLGIPASLLTRLK